MILSGMRPQELECVVEELHLPRFTAKQLAAWLYQKRVFAFDEMTNLSKAARTLLKEKYDVGRSRPVKEAVSADGTVKYLFQTQDHHYIESVYIPDKNRATLCVSSQVGCKMGCRFCMTGRQGFHGNLSVADILNQVYSIPRSETLTNIVVMGQGEPFDNTDAILRAVEILTADYGLAWSPKRITVSTVGLIPGMQRFIRESKANLAVSLHFAYPDDRAANMPAQKAFPIQNVVDTLRTYDFWRIPTDRYLERSAGDAERESRQRRLSFEYIIFDGLNDQPHHLDKLVRLLRGLDCRVNLIPFNTIPDTPYRGADTQKMMRIRNYLTSKGLFATLRASRGQDIEAACGLLSTKEADAASF